MDNDTTKSADLLKFARGKQRGRPFQPGQSGNPAGKKPGTMDKRTACRKLLEPYAPALVEKMVELALEGDTTALKMCLDRLVAPFRPIAEPFTALPIENASTARGLQSMGAAIINAAATGQLSTDDARALAGLLESQRKMIEISDIVERIEKLEAIR